MVCSSFWRVRFILAISFVAPLPIRFGISPDSWPEVFIGSFDDIASDWKSLPLLAAVLIGFCFYLSDLGLAG